MFEQRPTRPALSWKLRVRLARVVELDFEQLDDLGVRHAGYANRQYLRTQQISDGVDYLGCEGLIVPSARHDSKNLVVYVQNLSRESFVEEDEPSTFAWSDSPG